MKANMTIRHLLALAACFFTSNVVLQADNLGWSSRIINFSGQREHSGIPTGIAIRSSKDEIAVAGDDHLIRIIDRNTGRLLRVLESHRDWVKTVKYHPDGNTLFSAGNDRTIMAWHADKAHDFDLFAREDRAIQDLAIDAKGDRLATVGFDNQLNLYDLGQGKLLRTVDGSSFDMRAVRFSPNGEWLAVAGRNGKLRVLRVDDGSLVVNFQSHRKRIRDLVFVNDEAIVTCSDDQSIRLNHLITGKSTTIFQTNTKFYSLAFLGANRIAAGSSDNLIRIIDIRDPVNVGILKGHSGTVCKLVVDGDELLSGSYDTEIRIWQMESTLVSTNKGINQAEKKDTKVAGGQPRELSPAPNPAQPAARLSENPQPTTTDFQIPGRSAVSFDRPRIEPAIQKKVAGEMKVENNSSFVVPPTVKETPIHLPVEEKTVNFSKSGFSIKK